MRTSLELFRPNSEERCIDHTTFVRRTFIVAGVASLALLIVLLAHVALIVFLSAILAAVLHALALPLKRHTPLGQGGSIVCVLALVLIGVIGGSYFFGEYIIGQATQLLQLVPGAFKKLQEMVAGTLFAPLLDDLGSKVGSDVVKYLLGVTAFTSEVLVLAAEAFLVVFMALYLGLDPDLYLKGFLALLPRRMQPTVRDALVKASADLHKWLLGQAVEMCAVGAVTGLGLWLIGVPLPLALGVLTGLLDFVPFAGPLIAALLASLVALAEAPVLALYTVLLFIAVQQLEGHVLVPLIQQWAAALPPALALVAVVASGWLFGTLGILVATPLAVVVMSLVKSLYVEHESVRQP